MTAFWRRLFHREVHRQGERHETTQRTQSKKPQSTLSRVFGSPSEKQSPPEGDVLRINCQERIHYPIYDPNNPNHNPNAPKSSTYNGWASFGKKKGRSKPQGRSTTKSLRRARSTIATLFHRPSIPFEHEVPETNHNESTPEDCDDSRQNRGDQHRPSQSENLDSTGATSPSSPQLEGRSDSDITIGGHRSRAFVRPQHRPVSSSNQSADLAGNERNQAYVTDGNDIGDPLSHFAAEQPTTPPPSYDSLPNDDHEAHGPVGLNLPVISPRTDGVNLSSLFSTSTTLNEAVSRYCHESPTPGDGGTADHTLHDSESAKQSCQLPNALHTDTDTSTNTRPHAPVIRFSAGSHKASSERSGSQPSLETGKQWLEVPKQRPSPYGKAHSEAGTEVDTEFGIEIYRTSCHREPDAGTEEDHSLLQSWLSSSGISQTNLDKQRHAMGVLNPDDHSTVQADRTAAELPAESNLSSAEPETNRLTFRSKSVYSTDELGKEGHEVNIRVAEKPVEPASIRTPKQAKNEQKPNCEDPLLGDTWSNVSLEVSDHSRMRPDIDVHCHGAPTNTRETQFEPGRDLYSPSNSPMSRLQGTFRFAVEAIDRLTGLELPESYTNLVVPPQSHRRTRQLQHSPAGTEDSSSGSNESGQSEPASSSTARTICSSASSACDPSSFLVKEGIAEKPTVSHQPEAPVKPVETGDGKLNG